MLLLLTGCGEKKLDCSRDEDGDKMKVLLNFNSKDRVESGTVEVTVKLEEGYTSSELDSIVESTETQLKDSGLDAKVSTKNNSVVSEINFKANQLETVFGADAKEDMGYEDFKKQLESEGAVCK